MDEFPHAGLEYYTVKEASEILKVSVFTIKRWLKSNKLKGFKLPGGQWRITRDACIELTKSN